MKDFESVFELVLLPVGLDYDAVGHSTWLHTVRWRKPLPLLRLMRRVVSVCALVRIAILEAVVLLSVHLVEERDGSEKVPEPDAHIDHAVVKHFIWPFSELSRAVNHLLEEVEGNLHVLMRAALVRMPHQSLGQLLSARLDALDQRAAREVIRLETTAAHETEIAPRLLHLVAANEDVDQRVESHVRRPQANALHPPVQLLGLLNHLLLSASFDQSVEGNLVDVEKVTVTVFKQELDNLNGFLDLVAVDAAVEEDVEENFSTFNANDGPLDDPPRVDMAYRGQATAQEAICAGVELAVVLVPAAAPLVAEADVLLVLLRCPHCHHQ